MFQQKLELKPGKHQTQNEKPRERDIYIYIDGKYTNNNGNVGMYVIDVGTQQARDTDKVSLRGAQQPGCIMGP